jgi:hypothetical protein
MAHKVVLICQKIINSRKRFLKKKRGLIYMLVQLVLFKLGWRQIIARKKTINFFSNKLLLPQQTRNSFKYWILSGVCGFFPIQVYILINYNADNILWNLINKWHFFRNISPLNLNSGFCKTISYTLDTDDMKY